MGRAWSNKEIALWERSKTYYGYTKVNFFRKLSAEVCTLPGLSSFICNYEDFFLLNYALTQAKVIDFT